MIEIPEWEHIGSRRDAVRLLEHIDHLNEVAIDTETTGLSKWKDKVVFWSLSDGIGRWCIEGRFLPLFKEYLQDPNRILIFHNANFDRAMLANTGCDIMEKAPRTSFRVRDTMVAHALFEDDAPHDLKNAGTSVICEYNNEPRFHMPSFRKVFGKAEKDTAKVLLDSPLDVVADYASLDAWVTMRLYWELRTRLDKREVSPMFAPLMGLNPERTYTLWDYFQGIEMPMLDVCYYMERHGAYIDQEYLNSLRAPMQAKVDEFDRRLSQIAGKVINIRSTKQLRELFFDKLGIEPVKWTKGGSSGNRQPSTDTEALDIMASNGVEAAAILQQHRKYTKLLGTYISAILDPEKAHLDLNSRIHTTFNLHVTRTGRLSSSSPNLQNIPMRDPEGAAIRGAFAAPPGKSLVVADYAQLEPRITAGLTRDPNMCKAILEGMDYHCWTTALMFGVNYDSVLEAKERKDLGEQLTPQQMEYLLQRRKGKTVGLGLTYGMGPKKLAAQLDISIEEAKELSDRYLNAYPRVRPTFDVWIREAQDTEDVRTILGRRRSVKGINSSNWMTYGEACRVIQNTPVQGHAAEIVKAAQIRLFCDDDLWDSGARMILQVHDEVAIEADEQIAEDPEFVGRIRHHMESPFEEPSLPLANGKHIPMRADPGTGSNWLVAKH
jgi:DNA polymerase I